MTTNEPHSSADKSETSVSPTRHSNGVIRRDLPPVPTLRHRRLLPTRQRCAYRPTFIHCWSINPPPPPPPARPARPPKPPATCFASAGKRNPQMKGRKSKTNSIAYNATIAATATTPPFIPPPARATSPPPAAGRDALVPLDLRPATEAARNTHGTHRKHAVSALAHAGEPPLRFQLSLTLTHTYSMSQTHTHSQLSLARSLALALAFARARALSLSLGACLYVCMDHGCVHRRQTET